jgi:nondiscriminating glutamyl-tRNA synthetase
MGKYGDERIKQLDETYLCDCIEVIKSRMQMIGDFVDRSDYFINEPRYDSSEAQELRATAIKPNTCKLLDELHAHLEALENFDDVEQLTGVIKAYQRQSKVKIGELYLALRYVLTATSVGAEIPKTMRVLGKQRVQQRLRAFVMHESAKK